MILRSKRAFIFAALITVWLLMGSCEQDPTILAEYEGVNLIANRGFDSADWTPDQGTVYMTYEAVTGVALPSGVTGAAVYRLEINNLVADGEFETYPSGSPPPVGAGWSVTGAATALVSGTEVSSGQSLFFDVPSTAAADSFAFDLEAMIDGYPANSNYILRFVFVPTQTNFCWFYFPTHPGDLHIASVDTLSIPYDFPDAFEDITSEFTSNDTGDIFLITGRTAAGYIDDFRIARTDIPLRLRINLTWADPSRPDTPLVSGWYKFSLWVRSDPDAASTPNSFAGDTVTIGIENALSVVSSVSSLPLVDGWAQISIVLFVQINEPDDHGAYVLELSVTPTDIANAQSRDVGSILITAPVLELFSADPS